MLLAGIIFGLFILSHHWMPAYAGMTEFHWASRQKISTIQRETF